MEDKEKVVNKIHLEYIKKDLIYVEKVIASCLRMVKKNPIAVKGDSVVQNVLKEFLLKGKTLTEEIEKRKEE